MNLQKQVGINGVPLNYRVYGQGRPVVLVHGFGEDGLVWRHQVAALEDSYLLLVPDLPGSGQSPHNTSIQRIDDMARAVYQVLQAEGIDRAVMLGHSMGGYIMLAFARLYPGFLEGMGLIHSTAFADSAEKKEARRKSIALIQQYGPQAFLQQAIPNLFGPLYVQEHKQEVDNLIAAGSDFEGRTLIQYYEAMMERPDATEVLTGSPLPVLFVIGELDSAIPFESSLQQCHLPLISYIHVLKLAGHMGIWEEADKVNGFTREYLEHI